MFLSTHTKISKEIYKNLPKETQDLLSLDDLIKGSIHPDRNLSLRLMMHNFRGSIDYILNLANEIITEEHTPKKLSFKLGVIGHFLQDMSCAYNSNPTYIPKFSTHKAYKEGLDKFDIESLDYSVGYKINTLDKAYYEIKEYIETKHDAKIKANQKWDLINALSLTSSIYDLILEEYKVQLSKNFSRDLNKHTVVIFSDTYYPHINGVSNTIKQYITYLKTNNYPYLLVCPKYDNRLWEMEMGFNIYHVNAFKFPFYPSTRVSVPFRDQLYKILNKLKPDVIHALTEFNLGLFGQRYAENKGIPFVSNYSSYFHIQLKHYNLGMVEKPVGRYLDWFHTRADLTTTPSPMSKDYLLNNGLDHVEVFSRGVDRTKFHPRFRSEALRKEWNATDKTVYLFSGRVSGEKDITVLCDAYETMPQALKDKAVVVVAGDGPELEELSIKYPEVIFTGFKTGVDLSKIYASADVFAFPSWSETFGNVVLESLGSGVPAIVVNQGGVLYQIENDVNGIIVPKQDVKAFQEAMIKLMLDKDLLEKYRQGALKTADERTWRSVFNKLQKDFTNLIIKYNKEND